MNELSGITDIAKSFTEKDLRPRREMLDAPSAMPSDEALAELLKVLADIRFFSMMAAEEDGGAGQGVAACAAFIEEVSRVSPALGVVMASHTAAVIPVLVCADEEQRKNIVQTIVAAEEKGEAPLFTLCWMEDAVKLGGGLGLEETETVVGEGRVSGKKIAVPAAKAAKNLVVLAKTEDQKFSFVCVSADAGGVAVGEGREMMGLRLCPFSDVGFDGVSGGRVVASGLAHKDVLKIFARFEACLGAVCVGMMCEAYAQAKSYAAERYQAGRMIIDHDAVREMLVGIASGIEKSRALVGKAAADETSPANLLCSATCAEEAVAAALDGIQILGGYGYMKDYPLERILRDAKTFQTAVVLPQCRKMEYMKYEVKKDR
ncbi:MAG: acyl-CoA dehydrogenase family protein [bacterium]